MGDRMNKGINLVELMVITIIIGLLAGIAVPQYIGAVEKSKQGEALHWLGVMRQSMLGYHQEYGVWATDWSQLDIDVGGASVPGNNGPFYFYYTFSTSSSDFEIKATRRDWKKAGSVPQYSVTINAGGNIGHPDGW